MYSALKRVLVGSPIATSEEHHTRLPKQVALPVFASDAISSTAYATQEILIVLVPAVGIAAARLPGARSPSSSPPAGRS